MNIFLPIVIGIALLAAAALIGATVNQYQMFPGSRNEHRVIQSLVLFACAALLAIIWTMPLWII